MLVERDHDAAGTPDTGDSRYRVTPDKGSTWHVEIAHVDERYGWRLMTGALEVVSPTRYPNEEYALNAAVRYVLDVESGRRPPS